MFLELRMILTDSDSWKFLFLQFITEEQASEKMNNESLCLHIKEKKGPKKVREKGKKKENGGFLSSGFIFEPWGSSFIKNSGSISQLL